MHPQFTFRLIPVGFSAVDDKAFSCAECIAFPFIFQGSGAVISIKNQKRVIAVPFCIILRSAFHIAVRLNIRQMVFALRQHRPRKQILCVSIHLILLAFLIRHLVLPNELCVCFRFSDVFMTVAAFHKLKGDSIKHDCHLTKQQFLIVL